VRTAGICSDNVVGSVGSFDVVPEEGEVPWIDYDPDKLDSEADPNMRLLSPLHVSVYPGETLYLPFLWYHHVSQRGSPRTIAVNHWMDPQFSDMKYSVYSALRQAREAVVAMESVIS